MKWTRRSFLSKDKRGLTRVDLLEKLLKKPSTFLLPSVRVFLSIIANASPSSPVFIFYFWVSAVFSLDVYTTCQFDLKMEVFTITLLTHNYLQFISLPFCFLTPFNFSNNVLDEAQVTTYLSNNLHIAFQFSWSLLTLICDVQIVYRLSICSFILFT